MELIERTDLRAIYYLASLPKSVSIEIFKRRKDKETNDSKYNRLQNYIKEVIKSNGVVSRTYTYSPGTDPDFGGRLFSGGSIQGMPREFRGLVMTHTTDIDMKNAHPTILKYLCSKYKILCPNLTGYISDRDQILSSFENREKAKALFLTAMNDNKLRKQDHSNKIFKRFDEEMKDIQSAFYDLEDFSELRRSVPADKASNPQGSTLNRIMCAYENKILQVALQVAKSNGLDIAVLAFDGFMVYGNHYANMELLDLLNNACSEAFTGLGIRWDYKPHCTILSVPEDFVIPENSADKLALLKSEQKKENQTKNDLRCIEFEKTHCKILNTDRYIIEYPNNRMNPIIFKTKEKLQNMYCHLEHVTTNTDKAGSIPFISYWTNNNPNIRSKLSMDTYPNPKLCPDSAYNLWVPFYAESLPEAPENYNGVVDFMKDHIFTLSGLDEYTAKYFECWIAQMIQFPEIKSNCPVLISKPGAGKGQTLSMLSQMLGDEKVCESTNPSRDVVGAFNSQMASGFLVNINEVKKTDTTENMGQMLALITDKKLNINSKGVDVYKVTSYHRFIITTNQSDPLDVSPTDRRFWIVRCCDRRIGDVSYFNKFQSYIDDPIAVKSLYTYFKNHPGFGDGLSIEDFRSNSKPCSEHQRNMVRGNCAVHIQWLIDFTERHPDKNEITMLTSAIYTDYKMFCDTSGLSYKNSSSKFGLSLLNDSDGCVISGTRVIKGTTKQILLPKVRSIYGIETTFKEIPTTFYDGDDTDEDPMHRL